MKINFSSHVDKILALGKEMVTKNPLMAQETGNINAGGDHTLGMDEAIETALVEYLKEQELPVEVYSEESGMMKIHPQPEYLVVFDPLDGSTNYRLGHGALPFGLLIAVYPLSDRRFEKIVSAGAIEYVSRSQFVYDGEKTLSGEKVIRLEENWTLGKAAPFYVDLYYPKALKTFGTLAGKVHVRWAGANAASLVYVLNEFSVGMGAVTMRPEEIGTMVALIKGAGGLATDLQGKDLGPMTWSQKKTYPLLAGNKAAVNQILTLL